MLSRGNAVRRPTRGSSAVNTSTVQVRHPQVAALLVVVDQPHAGGVALALFDHRLQQRAEEALDVRLAHQQIERELHDVGLDLREALGAAALGRLAHQRRAQRVRVARVDARRLASKAPCSRWLSHERGSTDPCRHSALQPSISTHYRAASLRTRDGPHGRVPPRPKVVVLPLKDVLDGSDAHAGAPSAATARLFGCVARATLRTYERHSLRARFAACASRAASRRSPRHARLRARRPPRSRRRHRRHRSRSPTSSSAT